MARVAKSLGWPVIIMIGDKEATWNIFNHVRPFVELLIPHHAAHLRLKHTDTCQELQETIKSEVVNGVLH